jgi:lipoate-protein ligase A
MAQDEWTKPIVVKGKKISGAAAREHRVKAAGGVTNITNKAYYKGVFDMARKLTEHVDTSKFLEK